HYCHAMAAVAISPFTRSLIVVMDGAGTQATDFSKGHFETKYLPSAKKNRYEECTVYLQEGAKLTTVFKRWQEFRTGEERANYPGWTMSEGLGIFYEESAKYIFNSIREAGKVMGLSPYGKPTPVKDRLEFLKSLDWDESFKGKGKKAWENSGRFKDYANMAASVQAHFEQDLFAILKKLNRMYPDVRDLIFTGGCALNCIGNMKILYNGYFDRVYIPPFPSDECIAFGAAYGNFLAKHPERWSPLDWSEQIGNYGPKRSVPNLKAMQETFKDFWVHQPDEICEFTAEQLAKKKLIAWFQGRSESGPRALGNRSILARVDVPGLKDHMNAKVKGREAFRPYGSTCLLEKASEYFEVPPGFESPFMSFAPRVRPKFKQALSEVTHVNGTSRIQTVSRSQNPRMWALIQAVGRKTGIHCVLNTSLNVMGQPIVETMQDAKRFLEQTPVDGLVIGDLFVSKKPLSKPSRDRA
ncbi:MAG: carbamoyltransferase C-terminal domain-containing protein, partial [Bdellovibrionia bacterium]